MLEGGRDVPTFRKPLIEHEVHGPLGEGLFQLEGNSDFVIRKVRTDDMDAHFVRENIKPDTVSIVYFAEVAQKYLNELEGYGILIPAKVIVAKDEQNVDSIYLAVEEIASAGDDKKLSESELSDKANAFYELWAKLLQYYEDKFASNEVCLRDLEHPSQYVYGKRGDDENNQFYLVDAEPRLGYLNAYLAEQIKEELVDLQENWGDIKDFSPLLERFEILRQQIGD